MRTTESRKHNPKITEPPNSCEIAVFWSVDNFVPEKASSFNKVQQRSTGELQLLQQESLRINKNP